MVMLAIVVLGDVGKRRGESQIWVIVADMVETGCRLGDVVETAWRLAVSRSVGRGVV